jgi:catechol 2,3-dioxygenase-like lactoylglutathione lyase family enzyme
MYKRLAHAAFRVKDMEKSLRFYCDVLGCEKIFELHDAEDQPWIVYLRIAGSQYVELFYHGDKPFDTDDHSIFFMHYCFEVDDLKTMYEKLIAAGYESVTAPKKGRDMGDHCMVKDPDGIKVELVTMHPNAPQLIYHKV